MGTKIDKIRRGDKFWCTHRQLGKPMLGLVICLTDEPGKLVGLQFKEAVPPGVAHLDCDGRGIKGHCIWAHPDFLYTAEEFALLNEPKIASPFHELKELPVR